jgi:23S rRNA pseudouridine1911/1915/1917 synthase
MSIDILFENQDLIILNKPTGIMVHADGKSENETLVDLVLQKYPSIKGVGDPATFDGEPVERSGVVHRLDKETSGVIIFAKHQEAFLYLKQQFKDRTVHKEYHAFVWGHFKEDKGFVDEPIGRNKNDFRKWTAGRGIRGEVREAYTNWEVVRSFADEKEEKFSFVRLFPKTGRTHQLRVHMKYLQRPIVSDHIYAESFPDALGFGRVALHAKKVSLLGLSGESIEVEAPYQPDFAAALARYTVL